MLTARAAKERTNAILQKKHEYIFNQIAEASKEGKYEVVVEFDKELKVEVCCMLDSLGYSWFANTNDEGDEVLTIQWDFA